MRALFALTMAATLALAVPARAEEAADEARQRRTEELYQSALQAITEGRKSDASTLLKRIIAQEPLHAGAWLDLAMIQCGLGHADEAERLFAEVETRFDPSPGMLEVIAGERETGCRGWKPASSSSVTLARGSDHNVNQGASDPYYVVGPDEWLLLPDFLPKRDHYTALSGEYTRELTANGSIGFAQYQHRKNDRYASYDSASLYAGVESPYRWGRWTLRTTAMVGLSTLGGNLYLRQMQLQARIGPPLPLPNSTQFTLMGGATYTEYLKLTTYDATTFEVRGQFTHRKDDLYASISAGVQADQAQAMRPGGNRQGYVFNMALRKRLWGPVSGELTYSRQGWESETSYAPDVFDQVRRQTTQVLRAALSYPVAKNHLLQLEVRGVRNRENISLFQYNNRQIQLSWQWQQP